jgi:hypothetical protein
MWFCPTSVARRSPLDAVDVGAADPVAVLAAPVVALVAALCAGVVVLRDAA